MSDAHELAERALEEALEACGAPDPRPIHRARLRELKEVDEDAYREAVAYYRTTLVPAVAAGETDALSAWTEYGRRVAGLFAPGRTLSLDPSGRAEPYTAAPPPDRLVLHLPDGRSPRALLVSLPSELSRAQRAALDLLVQGRQKPPDPPATHEAEP